MHPYERAMICQYLVNLASRGPDEWKKLWKHSHLPHWFAVYLGRLGLDEDFARDTRASLLQTARTRHAQLNPHDDPAQVSQDDIFESLNGGAAFVRDSLRRYLSRQHPVKLPARHSTIQKRLDWIGNLINLSQTERDILGLLSRTAFVEPMQRLIHALHSEFDQDSNSRISLNPDDVNARDICHLLNLKPTEVQMLLKEHRNLRVFEMVENRHGGDYIVSGAAQEIVTAPQLKEERVRELFLGKPRRTTLNWSDFAHLGRDADLVSDLVKRSIETDKEGINILLYGPPGTGKTQFACVLAARLGLKALFAGEADRAGEEPSRHERLAALAVGQRITASQKDVLLVVDEADDLFVGVDDRYGSNRKGAKIFMNRIVEQTPRPTIWISNYSDMLGASVLRRMTYAIRFTEPGRPQRQRIVQRIASKHKVGLTLKEAVHLSSLLVSPAILDHGVKTAHLCGGGAQTITRVSSAIMEAMTGRPLKTAPDPAAFDEELSRADCNLPELVQRIIEIGRKDISFCFSGMPGTGKSAFARHLAIQMGMEVIEKRASDILGMFVGQTEANIAAAFQEAERKEAFLIFDEADSLLQNRSGAQRSWEISQVNEMLTWMERHPMPFACTTNFVDSLDPATLRRFLFKVHFQPMSWPQVQMAFRRFFQAEAPDSLKQVELLTPGDFSVVARKATILGLRSPVRLAHELLAEVAAKPEGKTRSFGFGTTGCFSQ